MGPSQQPGASDPAVAYITALQAEHWKTRWQAAQALGELGDPRAIEPLIEALEDTNQWVRIVAAEALGQLRARQAVEALILCLDDPSIWVRRAAVVALGEIGDPRAVPPLVERLLHHPSTEWPVELRDVAARALGRLGPPALEALTAALEDEDKWVRQAAVRALGQMGNPQAADALIAVLDSDEPWLRSAAVQALARIPDARAVRAALRSEEAPRAFGMLIALNEMDSSVARWLTAALEDPDPQIRARAAYALGQMGETSTLTRLMTALGERFLSSPAHDRPALVLPTPEMVDALVAALQDSEARVRQAAAEALGQVRAQRAIPALQQALQDPDAGVREAAARALGEIGTPLDR